ncbi:hypothetical protein B0A50_07484 [Salinomyces thailandicus]|uniref:GED domain-containing protein n=1 Tax=Salinomyces thailandicus TaxID=706561 RepID=A0A4U0TNG1_9PEZI|nr:hypothetical protein B0A50_07484 [Salinomyces thailandica]
MLRNRPDKEINKSFAERNAAEKTFFSKGSYRDLPQDMLGIDALRSRLSQLLYKHLKTELPSLQKELNDKHRDVCRELEQLGEKRATPREQRRFLMGISMTYQDVVKAAVDGHYELEFFGDLDPDAGIDDEKNMRRLRAVVQHLNLQFAVTVRKYGHKLHIVDQDTDTGMAVDPAQASSGVEEPELAADYAEFAKLQEKVGRTDAIARVQKILIRSRGRELPGTFNPLLISELFWQQSSSWQQIAEYHIEKVASFCAQFIDAAIKHAASEEVAGRLQALKVDKALRERLDKAKSELKRIVTDSKHISKFRQLVHKAEVDVREYNSGDVEQYLQADVMKGAVDTLLEPDMDKTSSVDALDCQEAYYQEEVKYFISAITKQVIERCLLRALVADTLSPMLVGEMSDDEVGLVAAEAEEVTRMRANLEARKSTLENGQQTFESALGLFK